MNKNYRGLGIFIVIFIIVVILGVGNKKEIINWDINFDVDEKSPFGLFVFNKEAKNLFNGKLTKIDQTPYEYYNIKTKKKPHNILVIENQLDTQSWKKVLAEVSKGSDVMLISTYLPNDFQDSIGVTISKEAYYSKATLKFTETQYKNDSLQLNKVTLGVGIYFIKPSVTILGKSIPQGDREHVVFIKRKFGKGNIYVHTEPLFLTNYYLLKSTNPEYAEKVFSYLPNRDTIWFVEGNTKESGSLMRFILSKPALKYAWWLLVGGIILFVVFNAKRKQRIVPIIKPLQNNSVDFVRSIGNLYLQEGDFHDMMAKKAQYFLNKVRMDLLIDTQNLDDELAKKLHLKTGKPQELIDEAITLIKKAQDPYATVINDDLPKINKILDQILK